MISVGGEVLISVGNENGKVRRLVIKFTLERKCIGLEN